MQGRRLHVRTVHIFVRVCVERCENEETLGAVEQDPTIFEMPEKSASINFEWFRMR